MLPNFYSVYSFPSMFSSTKSRSIDILEKSGMTSESAATVCCCCRCCCLFIFSEMTEKKEGVSARQLQRLQPRWRRRRWLQWQRQRRRRWLQWQQQWRQPRQWRRQRGLEERCCLRHWSNYGKSRFQLLVHFSPFSSLLICLLLDPNFVQEPIL